MLLFDLWRFARFEGEDGTGNGGGGTPPADKVGDQTSPADKIPPADKVGDQTPPADKTPPKPAAFDEKAFGESRAARVAAEVYGEDYKLPDGVKPDIDGIKALNEFAKAKGLTKAETQELVDLQVARGIEATKQSDAEWNTMIQGWEDACKNDKEFGGDNYEANKGLVTRVAKALDSELPAELERLGLNKNTVLFRAFARLGTKLGDDKLVFGNAKPSAGDALTGLYNHPTSRGTNS